MDYVRNRGSQDDGYEDRVWKALAHPLRRRVLDVLRVGSRATTELASELGLTRHQLLVHLSVLRDADLVVTVAEGRVRRNHLNVVPLRLVHEGWLSHYETVWSDALIGLQADLEAANSRLDQSSKGEARRHAS